MKAPSFRVSPMVLRPTPPPSPRARRTDPPRGASRAAAALVRAVIFGGLCALAPGCAAVAAGGLGMMLSQEFQQGAQIVHYDRDVRTVWARAKETLAHLSSRQPIFDEDARRAYATVEGGSVSLEVVEVSEGRCRMAVKARKYGLQSADLALSVLDRIDAQIDG